MPRCIICLTEGAIVQYRYILRRRSGRIDEVWHADIVMIDGTVKGYLFVVVEYVTNYTFVKQILSATHAQITCALYDLRILAARYAMAVVLVEFDDDQTIESYQHLYDFHIRRDPPESVREWWRDESVICERSLEVQ